MCVKFMSVVHDKKQQIVEKNIVAVSKWEWTPIGLFNGMDKEIKIIN